VALVREPYSRLSVYMTFIKSSRTINRVNVGLHNDVSEIYVDVTTLTLKMEAEEIWQTSILNTDTADRQRRVQYFYFSRDLRKVHHMY
jgi:hypothetical protein